MGKAGSGKDCVIKELKKVGFKQIVVYTSRPRRKGEREGREYRYISDGEFIDKRSRGFFAEVKAYNVDGKLWRYGSPANEIINASNDDKNHIIILTPKGVVDVIKFLKEHPSSNNVKIIYLYANQKTILKRLKKRKDKDDSIQRRIKADNSDFKDATTLADYIIYNNDGDDIVRVAEKIIKCVSNN